LFSSSKQTCPGYTLISGGHDGAIRAWDLRTFHLVFDASAHRKKYDEGLLALAASDKYPVIASGGADSHIKILQE
jgi:striatin 1/3/4